MRRRVVLACILCFQQASLRGQGPLMGQGCSGPVLWLESRAIDLGTIPVEQEVVLGKIMVMNEGDELLEILKVTGPCACFMGASGDTILPPGNGGEIEVKFDKTRIESGPVRRLVVLETNDPRNKTVRVYFSFTVERSEAEELRLLRSEVTHLRREVQVLRADLKKVLAALNAGGAPRAAAQPSPAKADTRVYAVEVGDSAILGNAEAPVTITAFMDFECPFCVREYPKLKAVLAAYPQQVRLVFKHRPLNFHKKAPAAHAAAQLALEQGGPELFWKMCDRIMDNPKALTVSDLRQHARSLQMDLVRFDEVLADSKKVDALLAADMKVAADCNVRATPTIMIDGVKLADRSLDSYKARIESLLAGTTRR